MTVNLSGALTFLLVMLRMTGMMVFNPVFGRRNTPPMVSAGFAFVLAVLLTGSMRFAPMPDPTLFSFLYMAVKELSVGLMSGFILQSFLSILVIGGEVVDMQLGIGMAKVFDPGTNASVALSSSVFNVMFIMTFFATNNHLTYIYLTSQTFRMIPLGVTTFNYDILYYIPELFSTILLFAVKLCLPIVVIEVIVTVAVGIIMRIIPQINIFVINIQFKLLFGMFALVVLVAPFMGYFENLILICFDKIQAVWINFL